MCQQNLNQGLVTPSITVPCGEEWIGRRAPTNSVLFSSSVPMVKNFVLQKNHVIHIFVQLFRWKFKSGNTWLELAELINTISEFGKSREMQKSTETFLLLENIIKMIFPYTVLSLLRRFVFWLQNCCFVQCVYPCALLDAFWCLVMIPFSLCKAEGGIKVCLL